MNLPTRVRPAAVAGRFYPADATALAATVDHALARALPPPAGTSGAAPKALVLPHAGYVYSGDVAARGYATLRPVRDVVHRVVLIGPAHYVDVPGLAVSSADAFATPLGPVPLDRDLRARVLALPGVVADDRAHGPEHSLEVHLPFLQQVLADFTVLPLVVGRAEPGLVAAVLDAVWGGPETLLVVSSDLSHYLDYATAAERDRRTVDAIVSGHVDAVGPHDACGAVPVRGLVTAAARHGLTPHLLDLRSSGDTAGPHDRVVGYAAIAFTRVFGRSSVP